MWNGCELGVKWENGWSMNGVWKEINAYWEEAHIQEIYQDFWHINTFLVG